MSYLHVVSIAFVAFVAFVACLALLVKRERDALLADLAFSFAEDERGGADLASSFAEDERVTLSMGLGIAEDELRAVVAVAASLTKQLVALRAERDRMEGECDDWEVAVRGIEHKLQEVEAELDALKAAANALLATLMFPSFAMPVEARELKGLL